MSVRAPEPNPQIETFPRRRGTRVRTDEAARCVVALLAEVAGRVPHVPAIKPPEEGMIRLGGMDRASYVWFIPCREDTRPDSGGVVPHLCNHGIGIDRQYGSYQVRAWVHGAPGVHSVELHTNEVTLEMLETAANLVGIPLNPRYDHEHPCPATCIEGVECCICHKREQGTAPAEDHHDADRQCRAHVALTVEGIRPVAPHVRGSHDGCLACMEYRESYPQEYSFTDPEGA